MSTDTDPEHVLEAVRGAFDGLIAQLGSRLGLSTEAPVESAPETGGAVDVPDAEPPGDRPDGSTDLFSSLGDGLRDLLDPRSRAKRK